MGLIVKYSSEQKFVSFSENVSDRGNGVSTALSASLLVHLYIGGAFYSILYCSSSQNVRVK